MTESTGSAGQSLPQRFPIFPLSRAIMLPGGNLPLRIFEPRYLAMVRDAMKTDRMIGMIQPKVPDDPSEKPEVFTTGCVGRISNFAETDEGHYMITLTGLCRFDVSEELTVATPYRQVIADYDRWMGDLAPADPSPALRQELFNTLKGYFAQHDIRAEWEQLKNAPLVALVTSLAMICPFEANEKQALLEARDIERQTRILIALMQMDAAQTANIPPAQRH